MRGIEHARKDPFCDGFIFWTIVDYTHYDKRGKVPCCQGLFDPFWRAKPHGATPEDVARVNSPVAILLDTEGRERVAFEDRDPMLACGVLRRLVIDETNRVFTAGEKIPLQFILSNYSETDIGDLRLDWKWTAEVRTLATSSRRLGKRASGPAAAVAEASFEVPSVEKPVKAVLTATLGADGVAVAENSWDFWFFPKTVEPALPENVAVAVIGSDEAEAARRAGKSLLLVGNRKGERDIMLGWWSLAWRNHENWTQNGVAALPHPLFGDFPFEPYLSPLLFRIIGQGTPLPVEGFVEKDFVMVGEGIDDFKLYLAAKERSDGGREVFVSGLDLWSGLPEGRTLLSEIFAYLAKYKLHVKCL